MTHSARLTESFFHSASSDSVTPGFPWSLSAAVLLHTEQVRMSYDYLATIDLFCLITGVLPQEILHCWVR